MEFESNKTLKIQCRPQLNKFNNLLACSLSTSDPPLVSNTFQSKSSNESIPNVNLRYMSKSIRKYRNKNVTQQINHQTKPKKWKLSN